MERPHQPVLVAVLLTLTVVIPSAFVRSRIGLDCLDWPGRYGQITVPAKACARLSIKMVHPNAGAILATIVLVQTQKDPRYLTAARLPPHHRPYE